MPHRSFPSVELLEIAIPYQHRTWRISAPLLKLALKYGITGPWENRPWEWFNQSLAFDVYSMSRGPARGSPNLADLCATMMMGSGIRGSHLPRFIQWVSQAEIASELEAIRELLTAREGLYDLPISTIERIGGFIDRAAFDAEKLKFINHSRLFKWLAAWAPAHVPMLDSLLQGALQSVDPTSPCQSATVMLARFQQLVSDNLETLLTIGRHASSLFRSHLGYQIPPVRILDNLLWFDWDRSTETAFHEYIVFDHDGPCHYATEFGRTWLAEQLGCTPN